MKHLLHFSNVQRVFVMLCDTYHFTIMSQWFTKMHRLYFFANVTSKVTSCLGYMIHKVNAHFTMFIARPNPEAFSMNRQTTNFTKQRIYLVT